jgi:hypothetical protein
MFVLLISDSPKHWSAFRFTRKPHQQNIQSFGVLEIHNTSHLLFIQNDALDNSTMDHFWLVQENHGQFVENISCRGPYVHKSCICKMPLMSLIAFFIPFTLGLLLAIPTVGIYAYRLFKRRSEHLHKIHGICNNNKSRYNRSVSDSSFEDSNTEHLLEDFDL